MSQTTTAVITFIDAAGNKASIFQAHNGHPNGPEGVLLALRPLRRTGKDFDAGKMAADYIGINYIDGNDLGLHVCRKPKLVDARFRYTVISGEHMSHGNTVVFCHERERNVPPLFVVPFDDTLGKSRKGIA